MRCRWRFHFSVFIHRRGQCDPKMAPVTRAAPLRPLSPYGTSKLMTELMLRDATAAHDLRFTTLRYFNVIGTDPQGRSDQSTLMAIHLIKVAFEATLDKRNKLTVCGQDYGSPDGTGIRDYIHVSDLAHAHRLAVERLRDGGQSIIMNCGYGTGFSALQVIEAVKQVSGVDFTVEIGRRRPGDSLKIVADSSLLQQEVNWSPLHNEPSETVKDPLAWEKKLTARSRSKNPISRQSSNAR
jgi:UDP-glucose 4-epimerase